MPFLLATDRQEIAENQLIRLSEANQGIILLPVSSLTKSCARLKRFHADMGLYQLTIKKENRFSKFFFVTSS